MVSKQMNEFAFRLENIVVKTDHSLYFAFLEFSLFGLFSNTIMVGWI
jgi:hypothetical protein